MVYLGWIIAAFLAGFMIAGWLIKSRPSVRKRVENAGYFRGKSYKEILNELSEPQFTVRQSDGNTLRTWREKGYSISLLFDSQDLCLGVENEQ